MQMQTPKSSGKSSSEGAPKISPRSTTSDASKRSSGRAVRQLNKPTGLEPISSSPSIRTPKNTSPKLIDRKSPRSPISEKKRPGRIAELESQICQLQDALKTLKDQLVSSESCKKQATQDAQESRNELLAISLKLEESQKLLAHSSSVESHGVQELQDLSAAADKAWKSKLEDLKKQHLADSDALAAALNEIDHLKVKIDTLLNSEATETKQAELADAELNSLKENMAETRSLVEYMKNQLQDCKNSESCAIAMANETLLQLETAKKTIESLKLDGKSMEDYNAIALELDQSRERVSSLEDIVEKLKLLDQESEKSNKEEIRGLKSEVERLKSAVETAEIRCNEEQERRTMEITSVNKVTEEIKCRSRAKEVDLEEELKKSRADIEEMKANLMDKETELQGICEENDDLNEKLKNSLSGKRENELENEIKRLKDDFDNLNSKFTILETELRNKSGENETLKMEIKKMVFQEKVNEVEPTKGSIDYLMEEIEKSNKKVVRVNEQLEATQAANCEMETELRKLKIQSDQWRKAAEAAASMLNNNNNDNKNKNNNGKLIERTGSMDSYSKIGSPYGEDMDDEDDFLKKKNGNMLKRIGVLWKKPQNK